MPVAVQASTLTKVRWGLARVSAGEAPADALLETPWSTDLRAKRSSKEQTLAAGFWFLSGNEKSEQWERQSLLLESCRRIAALACVVQAPPGWLERSGADRAIFELLERWKNEGVCPLYFDFGKSGPPHWMEPRHAVTDPLWEPSGFQGDYWRVHGWHPTRWVRQYSTDQLTQLKKQVARHQPRFVVLAHSQRLAQWDQLNLTRGPHKEELQEA